MVQARSRSCLERGALMPITPFLGGISFDPETKRIMGLAFEMARVPLGLNDHSGPANEVVVKQIIELAKSANAIPICCAKSQ
jgi:hypothetical protein